MGILSAGQLASFRRGGYDEAKILRQAWLVNSVGTETEITDRITDWGDTEVELDGFAPHQQDPEPQYPTLSFVAKNDDLYLMQGAPGSYWGSEHPAKFRLRFKLTESISDPAGVVLVDTTFRIVEPQTSGDTVALLARHQMKGYLAKPWTKDEHTEALDLNGFGGPAT